MITCNASDPYQQWKKMNKASGTDRGGSSYVLENVGLGLVLDSSVGGSVSSQAICRCLCLMGMV